MKLVVQEPNSYELAEHRELTDTSRAAFPHLARPPMEELDADENRDNRGITVPRLAVTLLAEAALPNLHDFLLALNRAA